MFFIFYMTDAVIGYFSIYVRSLGFSTFQLGILSSGASLVAIFLLPYLGSLMDRSSNRNRDFILLLVIASVLAPLLTLRDSFVYLLIVYTLFTIFSRAKRPLSDAIVLDHVRATGSTFGPIRVMGCLGYSLMALIAGKIADRSIATNFLIFAGISLSTALIVGFLPKPAKSGDHTGEKRQKASIAVLLQYKSLIALTLLSVLYMVTKSFYGGYFSIYFVENIGGTPSMYGWLLSLGALLEIPSTFFLDFLMRKFGARRLLVFSVFSAGCRYLCAFFLMNPTLQITAQAVFASTNMLFSLTMTLHINQTVRPEHRVTSLATYSAITSLASIIMGSFVGGALSSIFTIRPIFMACALLNIVGSILFIIFTQRAKALNGNRTATAESKERSAEIGS
jgi:PPP family 3-phenylpropionic acid transporter